MVVAAVVSVTQLAAIGSWGRSLRLTTLLQGIAVGFLVCGFVTVAVQFIWTRIVAAVASIPVRDVQEVASWTVDPFLEELVKVAPLLLLALWRPRTQKQLGYTDHLLFGAALGMGFELLESALRYVRLGRFAGDYSGTFVVDGSLGGLVTVPHVWESLFTWQPSPAAFQEFLGPGGDSIQHLVWTALAAVGVAWLTRKSGPLRLLGLLPLLLVSLDHANHNFRVTTWDAGWASDAFERVGEQFSWILVVALLGAVAADRVIQWRGRRAAPGVLLPGEPATGLAPVRVAKAAFTGFPWSPWIVWQVVLSRRAAMTALTARRPDAGLSEAVVPELGLVDRAATLPRAAAVRVWREAVKRTFPRFDWRVLRSVKAIIWVVALLPALAYLVVGAFPATRGIQQVLRSDAGLWIFVVALLAGGVLTALQLRPTWRALRDVIDPALHERRLRLQARFATAVASLGGGVLLLGLAIVERDPSASIVSTYHVIDALSDALLVLGIALIVGSFVMFPPFALVGVAGGGAVLVPTVTGSLVVGTAAGAVLTSAGVLMNESAGSSGSGSSGSGGGGNPPPRFTDNTRQSRTYGNSISDISGQAQRYADRMRRQGYEVSVPSVRTGKYSGPDITVTVIRNGVIKHIRHFIVK
jgi:hypothetical protein